MNKLKTAASLLLGLGVGFAASQLTPKQIIDVTIPAAIAFPLGYGIRKLADQSHAETNEAARVGNALSAVYETNRGLISAEQISIISGAPIDKVYTYLDALCEHSKGQKIGITEDNRVVTNNQEQVYTYIYSLPHPDNVLNEMNKNAAAWAESQTATLLQQIAQLRQQLATYQAQPQTQPVIDPNKINFIQQNNAPDSIKDPWNAML